MIFILMMVNALNSINSYFIVQSRGYENKRPYAAQFDLDLWQLPSVFYQFEKTQVVNPQKQA